MANGLSPVGSRSHAISLSPKGWIIAVPEYRCCYFRAVVYIVDGVTLAFVGILLLAVPGQFENWWLWGIAVYFAGALGVTLLLHAVVVLLTATNDLFLTVQVTSAGLVWSRFGKKWFLEWDEIAFVSHNGSRSHRNAENPPLFFHFSVLMQDDSKFRFGPCLRRAARLAAVIEEETIPRMLPRVLRAYESGDTLDFGRLKVNLRGWSKGTAFASWEDVSALYLDRDGWFTIELTDRPLPCWFVTSPTKIANFHLLLKLLEEIGRPAVTGPPGPGLQA